MPTDYTPLTREQKIWLYKTAVIWRIGTGAWNYLNKIIEQGSYTEEQKKELNLHKKRWANGDPQMPQYVKDNLMEKWKTDLALIKLIKELS